MKKITSAKYLLCSLCIGGLMATAQASPLYTNPASIGIDLTGGWFKASLNDGGYSITTLDLNSAPPSGTFLKVDPHGEFGGAVALTYNFAASPYSIGLSYWKIDTDSSDDNVGDIGVTKAPSTWGIDFATNVSSKINYDNDILRLALGATFHPDCNATITPQLGASYLRVKNDQGTFYNGVNIVLDESIFVSEKSTFKGFGPSFALDVDYKVGAGFSVFGDFIYSAFIGNIVSSYSASATNPNVTATNIDIKAKDMLVSLLQTEVGLSYLFLSEKYAGKLMIGYAAAAALGATENGGNFIDDVNDSKFVSGMSNVGFQGPFARVSFDFNI